MIDKNDFKLLEIFHRHENEVISLDFSPIDSMKDNRAFLMASGSRDHKTIIHNCSRDYIEKKVIEDHTHPVVGVNFTLEPTTDQLSLVTSQSTGIFYFHQISDTGSFKKSIKFQEKNKIFSQSAHEATLVLGMDKKIKIGKVAGKLFRTSNHDGFSKSKSARDFIATEVDPSGLYMMAG